jgi:hypothetical protein
LPFLRFSNHLQEANPEDYHVRRVLSWQRGGSGGRVSEQEQLRSEMKFGARNVECGISQTTFFWPLLGSRL